MAFVRLSFKSKAYSSAARINRNDEQMRAFCSHEERLGQIIRTDPSHRVLDFMWPYAYVTGMMEAARTLAPTVAYLVAKRNLG